MRRSIALWAAAAFLCLSCGARLTEPEPEPEFGTLLVSISTAGNAIDGDGYLLIVTGRKAMTVGVSTTVMISDEWRRYTSSAARRRTAGHTLSDE